MVESEKEGGRASGGRAGGAGIFLKATRKPVPVLEVNLLPSDAASLIGVFSCGIFTCIGSDC